eukprot:TRINITY_DN5174_c0_g1_i5.p2 TRINITY_DN5174_c0_g1~~TRINITY_DN5174_c0_g1_i5.p2  ORF type:complete len:122 (+),score=28.98 TRINITY_DN5174_c0_g1_i5:389-754(+)
MSLPYQTCIHQEGDVGRRMMDEHAVKFNEVSIKIAQKYSARNTGSKTFHTVIQPGISGFNISHFGENFLSEFDCFHPDLPADEAFTISIWNNMFQPEGNKSTSLHRKDAKISCPMPDDFLQ